MKKPQLSRQQRREQRQRQASSGQVSIGQMRYALPPGVTRQQFLAVAAREWAAVTGGTGVVLDADEREVPAGGLPKDLQ